MVYFGYLSCGSLLALGKENLALDEEVLSGELAMLIFFYW